MLTDTEKKHLDIISERKTITFPETFSYSSHSGKIFPVKINISKSYRPAIQDMEALIPNDLEFDVIIGRKNKGDYFSTTIAEWLDKDSAIIEGNEITEKDLNGKKILAFDDMIYTGYSMKNSWIPASKQRKGRIVHACFYINEENGHNVMEELKIPYTSLITLNSESWERLYKNNAFAKDQYKEILEWREDKNEWAKKILTSEKGLDELLKLDGIRTTILTKGYPQYEKEIREKLNQIIDLGI